jgi:hypothetical protein
MRARFIRQVGVRGWLRIYWDREVVTQIDPCEQCGTHVQKTSLKTCPNCLGGGHAGYHDGTTLIADLIGDFDVIPTGSSLFGEKESFSADRWPTKCNHCGAPVPANEVLTQVGQEGFLVNHQVFVKRLYDSPSGDVEPGDLHWLKWHDAGECPYWDNCDGLHLNARVPNGDHWDITSRASNCTMKNDRQHRCWVLHGRPEDGTVHVDKAGVTCQAGAGSIQTGSWHGFLHNGQWVG